MRFSLPRVLLVVCFLMVKTAPLRANGGAWQVGVASTGNGTATDKQRSTDVAIEEANRAIDLHQEFAAIEVRYRMAEHWPEGPAGFLFPGRTLEPRCGRGRGGRR
jgi:hypothetical protein